MAQGYIQTLQNIRRSLMPNLKIKILEVIFAYNETVESTHAPLAERLRPGSLAHFVGQDHLVGEGRLLRNLIEGDRIPSLILWGPPGCGKTTLANIIARTTGAQFIKLS